MIPRTRGALKQLQPDFTAVPATLCYYDPELQNAANAEPFDKEKFQSASEKVEQLNRAYLKQLLGIADRVSKRTFSHFANPKFLLFDADLLEFTVGDGLGHLLLASNPKRSISARATFESFNGHTLHTLTYSRIAAVNVNVPANRWFSWGPRDSRIDSLLANELTAVNANLMRHSFLFASGATISLEFERVKWETRRK